MATTFVLTAASPHSLVGYIVPDAGVAASLPRTDVLAACVEGPLKALLTKVVNWTVFNLNGPACERIHVRTLINRNGGPEPTLLEIYWEAAALKFNCDAGTSMPQIEIRLQHSSRA
jgi:hypothetical protein